MASTVMQYWTPYRELKSDRGWASYLGEGAFYTDFSLTAPGFIVFL